MAVVGQRLHHRVVRRQAEAAAAGQHHRVGAGRQVMAGDQRVELPGAGGRAAQLRRRHRPLRAQHDGDAGHASGVGAVADAETADRQLAARRGQRGIVHADMLSRGGRRRGSAGGPRPVATRPRLPHLSGAIRTSAAP